MFCVVILGVVPDMIPFHEASCRHTYASLATNPRDGYRKLLSGCFCSERGGMVFSGYTSLVCAGCYYFECEMNVLSSLIGHPQVLAIGEAGLDKLADAPTAVQIEVFEYQAQLSVELGKPLVIHLVKAVEELLKLKQRLQPANPWIIHGFRGKPALAQDYVRHGFYLSFGEKYQEESLRTVPAGRLLLETDESGVPIMELYRRASEVRGIPLDRFMEDMQENIDKVFFKR